MERDWSRLALATRVSIGFAAKIGFELLTGGTLFVNSSAAGMTPVPLAHVVGGLIGLGIGLTPVQRAAGRSTQASETIS